MSIEKINLITENAQLLHEAQREYVDNSIDAIPVSDSEITNSKCVNNAEDSIAFGDNNYAGYMCHKVLAYDNDTLVVTLDSDASTLAIGDTISLNGGINYPYCAVITAIDGNTITVDRQIVSYLDKTTPIDPNTTTYFLWVDGKTNTGNNALEGGSVALGWENHAIDKCSFAAGRANKAAGSYAVALGRTNTASSHSVAMGKENNAKGMISLALGESNNTSDRFTVAMGQKNKATAPEAIAIGNHNEASGEGATALGWQSKAENFHSIAISGTATGRASVAISGTAEGDYAIALGGNAKGENSVNLGDGAIAEGAYSLSANQGQAKGISSTALGSGIAEGSYGLAANRGTIASGGDSVALGNETKASGYASVTMGKSSQALGSYSFAGGRSTWAGSDYSFAYGLDTYTDENTPAQFTVGKFNTRAQDALFVVGNGEDAATRANAFVVMKDGSATIKTMGATDNSVATKKYVDDHTVNLSGKMDIFGDVSIDNGSYTITPYGHLTIFDPSRGISLVGGELSQFDISDKGNIRIYSNGGNVFIGGGTIKIGKETYPGQSISTEIYNLVNPTNATDAANKGYVDSTVAAAIGQLEGGGLTRQIVDELPDTASASEKVIYMVPNESGAAGNVYDEYMFINGSYDLIGNTAVDLSGKMDKFGTVEYLDEDKKTVMIMSPTLNWYTEDGFTLGAYVDGIPFIGIYQDGISMGHPYRISMFAGHDEDSHYSRFLLDDANEHIEFKVVNQTPFEENGILLDPRSAGIDINKGVFTINATGGVNIHDVVTPVQDNDAVNKKYIDNIVGDIETALDNIISIQENLIGGAE